MDFALNPFNLPNKDFKVMIFKMLIDFRRMDEHSKNFNKGYKM